MGFDVAREMDGSSRDLLRFVACGSVDDGKSTLIGRLLAETGSVPEDQLENLARLSQRYGTAGDDLDYALLLDGLEAEREQGITIDVAYRYFATKHRAFVVADTPGHEQYTRNMATGASNADLAVLLVDAGAGLTLQTMRHSRIAALLGIRQVLLVVNKMDLAAFSEKAFADIRDAYERFAAGLGFAGIAAIPASARFGDNVARASDRMPWYSGLSVLEYLDAVDVSSAQSVAPLRFMVQSVTRADGNFRGYAGFVGSGTLGRGDNVTIARSGLKNRIARVVTFSGDCESAGTGAAVTLVLEDHTDVARGDIIAHCDAVPDVADQFAAHVVWMNDAALLPGRTYSMRLGTHTVPVTVTALKHKIDIDSGDMAACRVLEANEIGFCNISSPIPVALDPYASNRSTGAFILIDRVTGATVGAGMVSYPLRRAQNVKHQHYTVDKAKRAHMKAQRPCVVWFTGFSGSGKSTVMNLLDQQLNAIGVHTYVLDGDNMRGGLSRDLGFTDADRVENIRRAGEVARLMVDAGLVVLCAFISPFRAERRMVRELVEPDEFMEVFVDTPLDVCMSRDPKGLYAKARAGKAMNVTGVDSAYEPPEAAEMSIDTTAHSADSLAKKLVDELVKRGIVHRA